MPNIATIIRNAIAAQAALGVQNDEAILEAVRREHPAARTTSACVSYYRSEARRVA